MLGGERRDVGDGERFAREQVGRKNGRRQSLPRGETLAAAGRQEEAVEQGICLALLGRKGNLVVAKKGGNSSSSMAIVAYCFLFLFLFICFEKYIVRFRMDQFL